MKNLLRSCLLLLCVMAFPLTVQASPLGPAGNYNVFLLGDLIQDGTDDQGRVAVKGNATLTNFSIASEIEESTDVPELIVGGKLTASYGSVGSLKAGPNFQQGDIVVGGIAEIGRVNGYETVGYKSIKDKVSPLPINFAAEENYLKSMSTFWGSLAPTGSTKIYPDGDEVYFTGFNNDLNTFYLDYDYFSALKKNDPDQSGSGWHIEVPDKSTVLLNISGEDIDFSNIGFYFNKLDANNAEDNLLFPDTLILWNLFEADILYIEGIGVQGSILAPWANVEFYNGRLDGGLIAASLTGNGEPHNELFKGELPVPEPATIVLLVSGLASLAALRRRMVQ